MMTIKYHNKRRFVQLLSLAVFILIPVFGLFRIDLDTGDFTILSRQVWWSDYFLMLGTSIMLICLGIMSYSTIGAVWCGWACPQNTVSEWANNLTHKMLGKRADVSVDGEGMTIAADKNKVVNWLVLVGSFLLISLILGFVPFFYFYPPETVWGLVTFTLDDKLSGFMLRLYVVFVVTIFLDIAVVRYFLCDYGCLYRLGFRFFKSNEALHIRYDASRSNECAKCNYCATSCIINIDPSHFKSTDTCINCGECVDACHRLHERKGATQRGLLSYHTGEGQPATLGAKLIAVLRRFDFVSVVFVIGTSMFVWGIVQYQPFDMVAYRSEHAAAVSVSDYRVRIANKLYSPAKMTLSVNGLPEGSYHFDRALPLSLGPVERTSVNLHIDQSLPKGLYRVTIHARSDEGWSNTFQVTHLVSTVAKAGQN